MSNKSNFIPIPEFLEIETTSDIGTLGGCLGEFCGAGEGDCTTECAQYCMCSTQGGQGGCGESCSESCSESCGQSCGEDCGESSTTASLYFANIMETQFGVGLTNLSVTYQGGRTCEWYVDGVYKGTTSVSDGVPSGGYINITGLESGTTYSVECKIYRTVSGAFMVSVFGSVTTQTATRPSNWSWTTAELNAFNYHGDVKTLTWQRWNLFCSRVDEFRIYKGLTTLPSAAYMTSSDRTLTANRFNLVRLSVGSMYSTGITDRQSGQPVLGSYFTTLSGALNSIS